MNKKDIKNNIAKGIDSAKKISKKISKTIDDIKEIISFDFYDYIDRYGDYSFEEKEFNEIDNVILSMITYIDCSGIVSEGNKEKISIYDASLQLFKKYSEKDIKNAIIGTRVGFKLLEKISKKRRYRDILLFNYSYNGDDNSQFSAMTFDLGNRLYYIGFEGTDKLISGWEEDCKMSYSFPVEAQRLAIKYINKFTFKNVRLIIGGHSKGGNLALVSSMYTNFLVRFKIKIIYSNDGPGLRKKQLESRFFRRIEQKYIHIIPNSSIVGLFLRQKGNDIVVKSNTPGFISHDPSTWQVVNDKFERTKLTRFSMIFDKGFSKWLSNYTDEEREEFVKDTFDILREHNINTLSQFTENYKLIFDVLKSSKNVKPIVKEMSKELIKVIVETNLEYPLFKW